jgi:hemoglobin-like flavoprotein
MPLKVDLIRTSLELVLEREPNLTHRFYARLFARHPEVKPLFGGRSAEQQEKMLQDAIVAVVDHIEDAGWLTDTLGGLGRQHVDYGATEPMYAWVGACLVETLGEVAGDDWSDAHAAAWSEALAAVSQLMLAGAARR